MYEQIGPVEGPNIARQHPREIKALIRQLNEWIASWRKSEKGNDYLVQDEN